MALFLEALVADLERPHGRADRLPHPLAVPRRGLPRVGAVPVQEGCLEVRAAGEVLRREPGEVGVRRAQVGSPEVDHADGSVVHEPVARLPVAVRRDESRPGCRPRDDLGAQPILHVALDPVLAVEPREHLAVLARLVVVVGHGELAVQQGQQRSGLPEHVGVRGLLGALDEVPWEVVGHHEQRVVVAVQQGRCPVSGRPRGQPLPMRAELAQHVVVTRPTGLHDVRRTVVVDLQHRPGDQPPAVVPYHDGTREPAREQ
jgi:hypothetical protein